MCFVNTKIINIKNITNMINYDEFMKTKNIIHNDKSSDSCDNLKLLVETGADGVSYTRTDKLLLFNTEVLMIDSDNNYYYEYPLIRFCDIVDNINFSFFSNNNNSIKLNYVIGDKIYEQDEIKEFILVSAIYTEIKFRIVFKNKPLVDDIVQIQYRCYYLNNEHRKTLSNTVQTLTNKYIDGCVYPIDV